MKAIRTGVREWIASNDRGAVIKIGDRAAEDCFSPGELLQLSAAVCAGMSMDHRLTHTLGDDIHVTLDVEAEEVEDENRYSAIRTTFNLDLSSLSEEELIALNKKVNQAIERSCTIKRTLDASASARHTLRNTTQPL